MYTKVKLRSNSFSPAACRASQYKLLIFILPAVLLAACGGVKEDEKGEAQIQKTIDSSDVAIGISGKVFIIPSPIQTAMLIQKSGAKYDKSLLNEFGKVTTYSTKFQKCLNLGIYGADLGYTTLYSQTQDAISYFKVVNNLATDLGIFSAFDKEIMERFQKNIASKDSTLTLVSSAYRSGNDFLRNNNRNEEAALIIAGGWIETLQFAIQVMKTNANDDLQRRIAEQKNVLTNLINLLSVYKTNASYSALISELNDLKILYENVQYKYIFENPITDEAKKTTSITSKSEITITPENIKAIGEKVASIRGMIIA